MQVCLHVVAYFESTETKKYLSTVNIDYPFLTSNMMLRDDIDSVSSQSLCDEK
jgi:hypothetical protein